MHRSGLVKYFLIVLVFVSGMTSLALEMCASRLLGAYFGTSLYIWASLIGLILVYLTVGYFIGGRLADRYPSEEALCTITAMAALSTSILPFVSQSILTWSITGLAQVSSLYAISTCGSILGAFLPVLWLIPTFGVRRTLLIFGALLFAASLWGLRLRWRPAFALVLLALVLPLGPLKDIPYLIYEQESLYNYIQVTQQPDGTRQLILNEGQAIHSIYYPNPDTVLTGWYWDYFLAAPYFNAGFKPQKLHRVGIIGLAAGTIAHQFTKVYGPVPIDGVEIDPAIVNVGRKYFDMNEANLHVYVQDGRTFLETTAARYDLVAIDAFQQPYIPFQLTTREFFTTIRSHLSSTGVVVLNTAHTTHDYRLVQAFINTMSQVFPSVYTLNVPGTFNTEVMATVQPTSISTFRANLAQFAPTSVMGQVASEVSPVVREGHADRGIVFTDDRAPIEQITDQLLLSYIQQQ